MVVIEIIKLEKKYYKDVALDFKYKTKFYYDVVVDSNEIFSLKLVKKEFDQELNKKFTSKLYEDYLEEASAYSLINDGEIVGYLEVDKESWNNRLRITNILVVDKFRRKTYGNHLINRAKEIAIDGGFREIVLETQTCNYKEIEFYLKNGFKVNGIDLSCYGNRDVEKREVRLELVFIV